MGCFSGRFLSRIKEWVQILVPLKHNTRQSRVFIAFQGKSALENLGTNSQAAQKLGYISPKKPEIIALAWGQTLKNHVELLRNSIANYEPICAKMRLKP